MNLNKNSRKPQLLDQINQEIKQEITNKLADKASEVKEALSKEENKNNSSLYTLDKKSEFLVKKFEAEKEKTGLASKKFKSMDEIFDFEDKIRNVQKPKPQREQKSSLQINKRPEEVALPENTNLNLH